MPFEIDYSNMMSGSLPDSTGITVDQWTLAASVFADAHNHVMIQYESGSLGFMDLPHDTELLESVHSVASAFSGKAEDVLVLGIGGSALGPVALRTALLKPCWNELSSIERGGRPRLHVLDNVDPATIDALLARLDLSRVVVLVISKSGGTVETMAQYLIVRRALEDSVGEEEGRRRLVFITDPEKGALRAVARAEGIVTLSIPENVGGRFSVLSPVGLLPAALVGIDIAELLRGAADVSLRCKGAELSGNSAGIFACLQWLADTKHGAGIQALMPYSDSLRDLSHWFVQLWAESLGKIHENGHSVGPTPLPALGASDQHSQVQLFMEGPRNKTVTFISVAGREEEGLIPGRHSDLPELSYLGGHTLGRLLEIERKATAGALAVRGRMNATITLPVVDAHSVGALIYFFELATAYAGSLYGVDAFNQPGVELGKQFAYAMLGKPGSESAAKEWQSLPQPDLRWQISNK